jgi:hypothetical protein
MVSDSKKREKEESEDSRTGAALGDTLKKVFAAGVSAAFMTEEGIRSYLTDLKLPKEFLNILLQQANKSKEELMSRVGKEISGVLSKIDVVNELSKFAENHKFKITAEIEIIKKDKDKEPKIKE